MSTCSGRSLSSLRYSNTNSPSAHVVAISETEPAAVFEDRETPGDWRVEKFDEDGSCEVRVLTGPDARQQALDYTRERYGTYVEKWPEPYRKGR